MGWLLLLWRIWPQGLDGLTIPNRVSLDGSSFGCLSHSYYSCSSIKNLGVMAWTSIFLGLNHPDWIVRFFGKILATCQVSGDVVSSWAVLLLVKIWVTSTYCGCFPGCCCFFFCGGVGKIVSTRVEMFFNCRIGCRFPMVQECPRANRFQRDQVPGVPVSCTHDTPVPIEPCSFDFFLWHWRVFLIKRGWNCKRRAFDNW